MRPVRALAVLGPTAAGKTALAVTLARAVGGEVISVDSRQIYRGFDIGTAKPTAAELAAVPHHLISALPPGERCSAVRYAELAAGRLDDLVARGRVPVLCGGTGLYFRALRDGLSPAPPPDPAYRARLARIAARGGLRHLRRLLAGADPARADAIRPGDALRTMRALELMRASGMRASELYARPAAPPRPLALLAVCLDMPREPLYRRIEARVDAMFAAGLLDETRRLLAEWGDDSPLAATIGYAECAAHLAGAFDLPECVERVKRATRRYAKRQFTWFRAERGLVWLPAGDPATPARLEEMARAHLA